MSTLSRRDTGRHGSDERGFQYHSSRVHPEELHVRKVAAATLELPARELMKQSRDEEQSECHCDSFGRCVSLQAAWEHEIGDVAVSTQVKAVPEASSHVSHESGISHRLIRTSSRTD
jgi:hypothetical protein